MDNIELRCRAHNGYEAERHFGRWGAAAAREEPVVYASGASALDVTAVPGDQSSNSFRNEFEVLGDAFRDILDPRLSGSA